MPFRISHTLSPEPCHFVVHLLKNLDQLGETPLQAPAQDRVRGFFGASDDNWLEITDNDTTYFIVCHQQPSEPAQLEKLRNTAHAIFGRLKHWKAEEVHLHMPHHAPEEGWAMAEGLALSAYEFARYKPATLNHFQHLQLVGQPFSPQMVEELEGVVRGVFWARDLVNEPTITLTSMRYAEVLAEEGPKHGFQVETLHLEQIREEEMGGLLAVNYGSPIPPTFNILTHHPANAVNQKPIVLVGKGIVYDTGGLSLKPTPNSMDFMKADMGGSAAVAGAFAALARNHTPLWVIGLIPATDNRPGQNAYCPGDVITMHSGKTVEVLNTDAEGRLVIADALSYAQRYDAELTLDVATLTGAAMRALGNKGAPYMGTAPRPVMEALSQAGYQTYERLAELPLWEEYDQDLKSEVAELANIGGAEAGAIIAGMFLKHFVSTPWAHIDIAGVAFNQTGRSYWGKHASGFGVRLLYHFLKGLAERG